MTEPSTSRRRWLRAFIDPAVALGLATAYVALLLSTVRTLGYARDEGFYFQAAQSYQAWFKLLFENPTQALTQASVDRYWSVNHEHPALMKSLFALSHDFLFERWHWFREAGTAFRFPGMLMAGLAVAVTYLWGARAIDRVAGLVAALSFAFLPRVFYHSHLDCFDVPVAAMWLVTAYAYSRSLGSRGIGWALATGIAYGLLLDTKHNSWLFPGAVVVHFLLTRGGVAWRDFVRGRIRIPVAMVCIAVIGPLVFYAAWPWIWFDTGRRLADYAAFHLGHEYYNMEFLGRTYWKPPMPRLYAPVMTVATVSLVTLVLFALGLGHFVRRNVVPRLRHLLRLASVDPAPLLHAEPDSSELLWLLGILVSYAPWLSTNTPIFGGTKHWLTAYPFLCLFAGRGFQIVRGRLALLARPRWARERAIGPALAVSVLVAPAALTLHSHPWGLSTYTPLVGEAQGAATLGLNRTFWGYTTGSVEDYLNATLRPGARVFVHDTALQSWEMMRKDGRIRRDLRGTLNIAESDAALYQYEPHMGRVEYQIWVAYGTTTPAHVGSFDGVPVVWVYVRRGH